MIHRTFYVLIEQMTEQINHRGNVLLDLLWASDDRTRERRHCFCALWFSQVQTEPGFLCMMNLTEGVLMVIFQVRRHKKALWIDHHDTISVLAVGKKVLYSGSWDKTIKVWRLADLKCVESIAAHGDAVNALAVDPHRGFLYSGSADGSVKVWERRSKHTIKLPARVSSSGGGGLRHALVSILQPAKVSTINALALAGGRADDTDSSGFILQQHNL